MPNIQSAKKRVRTSEKRRLINKRRKVAMKKAVKLFFRGLETKPGHGSTNSPGEPIAVLFTEAISSLDRAAQKGVIHRNKANRKKSQLSKIYHQSTSTDSATQAS